MTHGGSKEPWHLDKRLSIGTIITLFILGSGSIAAFSTVQERLEHKADRTDVAVVAEQQKYIREDIQEVKQDVRQILEELREQLRYGRGGSR